LRDLSDRVFRTREQVERLLALDCLATVPKIKVGKTKGDLSRALSTNVRKTKGSATPVATIKVSDEPHGGLPPAPTIKVSDEPHGGLPPAPTIKVSNEPHDGLPPAPTIKVSDEPHSGVPPAPNVETDDESNGEALPSPNDKVGEPNSGSSHTAEEMVGESFGPRTIARRDQLVWQVVDFPLSPYAEAIRSIKMAVDLTKARISKKVRKPKKVLGITSSSPGEGKSTTAASLAQLISHSGKRVILVDCDLRAPRLTRVLAPDAKAGLLEVLSGDAALHDVIWTDQSKKLSFLPAVATARIPHTAEIIGAEEMHVLFDRLRGAYDYVIVDLTPLVPIIDVRASEALVDYYVFVIEWGRTKIDLVQRSLKEAPGIYNKIIGAVLNKVDNTDLKRYEGYGGYDHDQYYRR